MTEMGSIFNPGEAHMKDHLAAEKILPAPMPVAGAKPLEADDGSEIYIPTVGETSPPFEAKQTVLPPPVRAAHKPGGKPNED